MKKSFAIILGLAAVIAAAICVIDPATTSLGAGNRLRLAFSVVMCWLQLWASWYFLSSLREFKSGLRTAYTLIVIGMFLIIVPVVLFSIALVSGSAPDWLGIISAAVYFSSTLVVYLGVRRFAKLLSIHYIWNSIWFGLGLALLVAGVMALVPGAPIGIAQLVAWSVTFSLAATVVAVRIRHLIGITYNAAMTSLVTALALTAVAGLHETIIDVIWPDGLGWYSGYGITLWPYLLMTAFFLRAALQFHNSNRPLSNVETNGTFLDAVIYAAGLVSTPAAVDSALNQMRLITADMNSQSTLTAAQRLTLVEVYRELENYLLTKEPLRKITREDLRSHLTYDFQQALKAPN
ncbi:MAG TPA: hypothetical protein VLI05_07360 [Candidatus Saccharimonadia bacterium]|nr:hypothetical protein [Candidatus Saccharimonadia bacterium]